MANTKNVNLSQKPRVDAKWLSLVRKYSTGSNSHKPQRSPIINYTAAQAALAHYLSGLIEGDGYISITKEDRVILGITFNLKDKPLAEKLLSYLGKGSIAKRKTNCIELRFSHKQTLCKSLTY